MQFEFGDGIMPLDSLLLNRWWVGAAMMALVAISDYAFTVWGARLYHRARHRIEIEGSYETVPMFQADIDAGRIISPRFILVLLLMVGFLGACARFREPLGLDAPLYLFLVGFFVLIEAPIHVRHFSNIVRFAFLARSDSARGQITFSRWFTLAVSSVDFFSFGVLFLLGFGATRSPFVLGGGVRCIAFWVFQLLLTWKSKRVTAGRPHLDEMGEPRP